MFNYKKLKPENINLDFLDTFYHLQKWAKQYTNTNGTLSLQEVSKTRTWDDEKRRRLSSYLRSIVEHGGVVFGVFDDNRLIGFSAIEGELKGQKHKYANMSMLFVDDRYQRKGIGRKLIQFIKHEAEMLGAERVFISSIPSEDTVLFYRTVGAVLADEVIDDFVDTDEDIYFEIVLEKTHS